MTLAGFLKALGFARRHWWAVVGGLAALAIVATVAVLKVQLDRAHAEKAAVVRQLDATKQALNDRTAERDAAISNRDAWKAAYERAADLAQRTAEARAEERRLLTSIAADTAAAKEGIRNAPGADAPVTFSDAAYGFMRNGRR